MILLPSAVVQNWVIYIWVLINQQLPETVRSSNHCQKLNWSHWNHCEWQFVFSCFRFFKVRVQFRWSAEILYNIRGEFYFQLISDLFIAHPVGRLWPYSCFSSILRSPCGRKTKIQVRQKCLLRELLKIHFSSDVCIDKGGLIDE